MFTVVLLFVSAVIIAQSRGRPRAEWPKDEAGMMTMDTRRLDLAALLAEAPA
jgi:catechol-2,3-dioxygenase